MKVFKVKNNFVTEVECEEMVYPMSDSEGDTIYENTHYGTKKEAYIEAIIECKAGVSIATRIVKEARKNVRKYESKLSDECIDLERLEKEFVTLEE